MYIPEPKLWNPLDFNKSSYYQLKIIEKILWILLLLWVLVTWGWIVTREKSNINLYVNILGKNRFCCESEGILKCKKCISDYLFLPNKILLLSHHYFNKRFQNGLWQSVKNWKLYYRDFGFYLSQIDIIINVIEFQPLLDKLGKLSINFILDLCLLKNFYLSIEVLWLQPSWIMSFIEQWLKCFLNCILVYPFFLYFFLYFLLFLFNSFLFTHFEIMIL